MVERVFRPAFQSLRVIPRHLLGAVSRNDEFISLDLETREGQVLFSTTPAYPDGPSNALILPTLRGGLIVRAHLNPRIKDALIPGGIPPRIPVREIGLIGLSLALLIAIAALGLRVGALARLRSDLASSVTHELRTPLTQIRLAAETVLLGRSPSAEAERRSLASIVDETKRLQQLIDNVLHFSRAERQSTRVRVEPVELRPVVERAAGDLAPWSPAGESCCGWISARIWSCRATRTHCARSSSTCWTMARGTGPTGRRSRSAPRRATDTSSCGWRTEARACRRPTGSGCGMRSSGWTGTENRW